MKSNTLTCWVLQLIVPAICLVKTHGYKIAMMAMNFKLAVPHFQMGTGAVSQASLLHT